MAVTLFSINALCKIYLDISIFRFSGWEGGEPLCAENTMGSKTQVGRRHKQGISG